MDKNNLLYFIRARKLSKYLLITVALFSFLSNKIGYSYSYINLYIYINASHIWIILLQQEINVTSTEVIQAAALTHWQMLNGGAVLRKDFMACLRLVMGEHTGSPFHYLTRNLPDLISGSVFQQQTNSAELISRWQLSFNNGDALTAAHASDFLGEVYALLEEVDVFFTNHITPGATRYQKNHISDIVTRRPNSKSGWSIQLTTQGVGSYNCIRTELKATQGDIVLLGPDAFYDYRRAENYNEWEHQWIYFPQHEQWLEYLQWPEIGPNIYHLQSKGDDFNKLKTLFYEMNEIHLQTDNLSSVLSKNILEQILIRCSRLITGDIAKPKDTRISQVADYISGNFYRTFTVASLAASVGLSPARLSVLFKQETGTTIMYWRDMQRMARAAQLLVQTRKPIGEIAELVGYSDALYFSRCFSSYMNTSPREYRINQLRHR
jgi:AraC family transcriptional regulator of arabinose operon